MSNIFMHWFPSYLLYCLLVNKQNKTKQKQKEFAEF